MTEEEKNQAAAFMKLHEDVKALIVKVVTEELVTNPYGALSGFIKTMISQEMSVNIPNHMQNFRIVQRGTTAPY